MVAEKFNIKHLQIVLKRTIVDFVCEPYDSAWNLPGTHEINPKAEAREKATAWFSFSLVNEKPGYVHVPR